MSRRQRWRLYVAILPDSCFDYESGHPMPLVVARSPEDAAQVLLEDFGKPGEPKGLVHVKLLSERPLVQRRGILGVMCPAPDAYGGAVYGREWFRKGAEFEVTL